MTVIPSLAIVAAFSFWWLLGAGLNFATFLSFFIFDDDAGARMQCGDGAPNRQVAAGWVIVWHGTPGISWTG